jgi:YD repeat-containing protein
MSIGGNRGIYGLTRATEAEHNEHDIALWAKRVTEIPSNLQQLLDYVDRTDGQPIYMGFAEKGLAQSASGWLLHKYTYNASGQMTAKQISYDAWADRVTTTYE